LRNNGRLLRPFFIPRPMRGPRDLR